MNKFYPDKILGSKVYFTEADPVLHAQEALGYLAIETKLKAWLFLSDYLVVSGTHIMSSPEMYKLIKKNPRLVTDGIIIPYIRENISTFSDYLLIKNEENDKTFKINKKRLDQTNVAEFLDSNISTAIQWKPDNAIKLYQQSLVQELLDRTSSLRKKMIGVPKNDIHQLAEDISNLSLISRGNVETLSRKYLRKKNSILIRHSNFLYYLWGATHLDCEPILHPATYKIGIDKLQATTERLFQNQRIEKKTSSRNDEPTVFQQVLKDYGIINDALLRIPINVILDLRKEKEARAFRKKWINIVYKAKSEAFHIESPENLLAEELNGLYELLRREIRKEINLERKIRKMNTALSIGSFVTSGLLCTLLPEIGAAGIIASLAGVDPLVSAIQNKVGGLEISLFCAKIREAALNV